MQKLFLSLLVVLLFLSCDKDEKNGNVDLTFYLTYQGQPVIMFDTLLYPVTGQKMRFSKFATYLSEVSFKKEGGSSIDVLDIDYLDMTNAHSSTGAANGFTYMLKDIEPGNYEGFQFSFGVPAELNAKAPKDFPSGNVLSSSANYWSAWKSYIFMRTEGNIDFDGDNVLDDSFTLHTGGDEAFISFIGDKNFKVSEGQNAKIELEIDLYLYLNGESLYDIATYPSIHSLEHKAIIQVLTNNLKNAVFIR